MFKNIFLLFTAASITTFAAANAMAVGIGAYGNFGGGQHNHKVTTDDFTKVGGNADFAYATGGFILDTNVGGSNVFNYRLKIGGGSSLKYSREAELKLTEIELTNTFGFGIIRHEKVRFWLGPSIGFDYQWGRSKSTRSFYGPLNPTQGDAWRLLPQFNALPEFSISLIDSGGNIILPIYLLGLYKDKIKKIYFGGGSIGLTTGVNVIPTDALAICFEFGFKYDLLSGSQRRSVYGNVFEWEYGKFNDKVFVKGWNLFGSISIMYRAGE